MKKNFFIHIIDTPEKLLGLKTDEIKDLYHQYPYFQTLQKIYLKKLQLENDTSFETILKKVSISSINRKALYNYIQQSFENKPENSLEDTKVNLPDESSLETNKHSEIINTNEEKIPELEENYITEAINNTILLEAANYEIEEKDESDVIEKDENAVSSPSIDFEKEEHSFEDWLKIISGSKSVTQKSIKEDIIDKFIQEDITIKPNTKKFFSPANLAKQSVTENPDVVSETLALIYLEQGNIQKAIEAYERLMLKNPKKRTYFANQIKNLKNKI
ncbi:MAG: tetratricopeptide repeat protein [Vicingaceae bacterium]